MKKPPLVFIHPELILEGLLVQDSRYRWLLAHCLHGHCRPVSVAGFIRRIHRVLHDPVFQLSDCDRNALYAEFLPRVDILTHEQFKDRTNIVVSSTVLIPGMNDDEGIAYVSPWFYKSLIGLDDDPDPEEDMRRCL